MDYSIRKVARWRWEVEIDGASIGTADSSSAAARILEDAVAKRLPPFYALIVYDPGTRHESLGLEFGGTQVDEIDCPRTVSALVEVAWDAFAIEQPHWAWIRSDRPEAP